MFFEAPDQIWLSNRTRLHLQSKGITTADDLRNFAKAGSWTQILDNCKRPPQAGVAGNLVNQPAFQLPAKSLMRLKVASQAVEYYLNTGRALLSTGMIWTNRLRNFQAEKESLDEMKKNNINLDLPAISNKLKIIDWFEAYNNFCDDYVGQSGAPLSLVSRTLVAIPAVAPPLVADQPFSFKWGLVAQELVHSLSHTGAGYCADNKTMFS